jgi:hypothetical protein
MNILLVKEIDKVTKIIKAKETKLNLLFISISFFSVDSYQGK